MQRKRLGVKTVTSQPAIKPESVYMTNGRDYESGIGYECLIGAYEVRPSVTSLSGEPFPGILHRKGGFRTNAQAKAYGRKWARENLA